jgi:transmembrane 9 superfamily member 2/4
LIEFSFLYSCYKFRMISSSYFVSVVLLFVATIGVANGFYLPGVAPHSFKDGEKVDLKVNKLSSTHTQLPFDYYSLKYCRPKEGIKSYAENLGEFLSGDRIENSPYEINMNMEVFCKVLCDVTLNKKESDHFAHAIKSVYHNNWIIDNLPAASIIDSDEQITTKYVGFPVGYPGPKNVNYLYNHVNIILLTHDDIDPEYSRIVGFYVEPMSVAHASKGSCEGMTRHLEYSSIKEHQSLRNNIIFSYGIEWRKSDVQWASRWDIYLTMNKAVSDKVHWFSIVNSLVIVMLLALIVGIIMYKTIQNDVSSYNRVRTAEEKAELRDDSGWKLVHADVFRPPTNCPMLFSAAVGTGVQINVCIVLFLCFAAIGFLSPANRGSILIGMLCFFVLTSFIAGYVSARLFKTFNGVGWQRCTLLTALGYSGACFLIFFVLDITIWSYGSTGAIPIMSMFTLLFLWFLISVPLVFFGAYKGYQQDVIEYPVVTSNIPRQIPPQPWYLHPVITGMVGGVLPFGACFVELFFIMSSVWMDQYYYVFGFLLLVFIILSKFLPWAVCLLYVLVYSLTGSCVCSHHLRADVHRALLYSAL